MLENDKHQNVLEIHQVLEYYYYLGVHNIWE